MLRPSIFSTRSMRSSCLRQVLADELAVAQHGDAIADLVHLIEEVRYEQDGDAALLQLADDAEQLGDLVEVEARGRLVEHEHLDVDRDGARDRDELLHRERVRAEDRRGIDVDAEVCEHGPRVGSHAAPVDHSEPSRLPAERDVLGDRHVRQQVDLLIDRADPGLLRVVGRREVHELTADAQLAFAEREGAGDRLDERGLARAVLAHEGVDLAGEHAEVHAVDRGIRPEAHGRAGELQQRGGVVHHAIMVRCRARRRAAPAHHLSDVDPNGRRSRAAPR